MNEPAVSLAATGPTVRPPGDALVFEAGAIQLLTGPHGLSARRDVGVGPALLAHVVAAGDGAWLRLYRPAPTVALSRLDTLSPGFPDAIEVSLSHGFTPVLRAPGGRPVAYHAGALCLDLAVSSRQPRIGVMARFAELADLLAQALGTVGIDAGVGPLPFEYCPGRFSVNAGGRRKLGGTAQRIVRGGWLIGAVILVRGADSVRRVLVEVYQRLGLKCDPSTVGAVADIAPGVGVGDLAAAVRAAFAARADVVDGTWPDGVLESAGEAAPRHPALSHGYEAWPGSGNGNTMRASLHSGCTIERWG